MIVLIEHRANFTEQEKNEIKAEERRGTTEKPVKIFLKKIGKKTASLKQHPDSNTKFLKKATEIIHLMVVI